MLTPQEITDKVFVKAVFGGYDMTGVDSFLEAVCADYTALYKENAILKGKLKVLVEKVEEYRSTEDSMRMALLTAQRLGEEITTDANKQKDEIIRNAQLDAKTKMAETARKIADEELRLSVAAKETAKFIELSQAIIRKHSEFLTKLETARRAVRPEQATAAAQPAAAPQPTQQPAQQAAYAPADDEQLPIPAFAPDNADGGSPDDSALSPEPAAAPEYQQPQAYDDDNTKVYTIGEEEDDPLTPRPKFDFDDLKFGSNFNTED